MKTLCAMALALAATAAAAADGSYFEAGYRFGGDLEAGSGASAPSSAVSGYDLEAAFAIDGAWYAAFDLAALDAEDFGLELTSWKVAGGWRGEHLFATLGWEYLQAELGGFGSDDASGAALDLGARLQAAPALELDAHVGRAELGDGLALTGYGVGATWTPSDGLGLAFEYEVRSGDGLELSSVGVGVRFSF